MLFQVLPRSSDVATTAVLSAFAIAKYTRPLLSIPTAGSLLPDTVSIVALRTCRTCHVIPLSSETTTAPSPPQLLFGRYTVPSWGETFTCPCKPPHSVV